MRLQNQFLRILILGIIVFLPGRAFADPTEAFTDGNTAYQAGKYEEAIQLYERLVSEGWQSADLLYNLGNAYYKNQNLGLAILNFERALLLSPFNQDINHNLELAYQKQIDEINVLPPFFVSKWWNNLSRLARSNTWSVLGLIAFWLAVGGFIYWQLAKVRNHKKLAFLAGGAMILLTILFLALAYNRYELETSSGFAILVEPTSQLRSAPDAESKIILGIHEGVKMELLDQIGDWYKVRLLNGEQGWVAKGELGLI